MHCGNFLPGSIVPRTTQIKTRGSSVVESVHRSLPRPRVFCGKFSQASRTSSNWLYIAMISYKSLYTNLQTSFQEIYKISYYHYYLHSQIKVSNLLFNDSGQQPPRIFLYFYFCPLVYISNTFLRIVADPKRAHL